MARSFHDDLARSLGVGNTVVGFFMMVMFTLLPLGIFANVLDLKDFFWLKLGIAVIFSFVTFLYYIRYAKTLKLSPIVLGFGIMISILMSGALSFVTVDIILKVLGLE